MKTFFQILFQTQRPSSLATSALDEGHGVFFSDSFRGRPLLSPRRGRPGVAARHLPTAATPPAPRAAQRASNPWSERQ